jgi:hypothetical protein
VKLSSFAGSLQSSCLAFDPMTHRIESTAKSGRSPKKARLCRCNLFDQSQALFVFGQMTLCNAHAIPALIRPEDKERIHAAATIERSGTSSEWTKPDGS